MLKIQSIRASLDEIDSAKLPDADAIHECLEVTDESLKKALGYRKAGEDPPPAGSAT